MKIIKKAYKNVTTLSWKMLDVTVLILLLLYMTMYFLTRTTYELALYGLRIVIQYLAWLALLPAKLVTLLYGILCQKGKIKEDVSHMGRQSNTTTLLLVLSCLLIDGVFIGINIKELPPTVKFDESYPSRFHYYDLDFSLECNKNGVKIGVVDIPIIHSSPGLTNPDKEFYDGQQYFINKWTK
jgi:hypothetical protein